MKKMIKISFIIMLFFVSMISIIDIQVDKTYDEYKPFGQLTNKIKLKQVIYIDEKGYINGIDFKIGTFNRVNQSVNTFNIYLNNVLVQTYDFFSNKITKDNIFHRIPLSIYVNKGDEISIELSSDGKPGNSISPYVSNNKINSRLYIFNRETNKYDMTDKTLVYKIDKKTSIVDFYTRINQLSYININNEMDMLDNLSTWVAINDKIIFQKIETKGIYSIDTLSFRVGTFGRTNNNTTNVYIVDKDNNIRYQTKVMSNELKDNSLYTIENIGLKIKEDDELYLKIESMDDNEKNFIALYTIPPNLEAPMKLIDENNKSEAIRQDSLFYAINGNVSVEVFANIKYKEILQGSTYKVIEDNKSIRNSKILFYIIWFGLVTSFVLLISAIIEYIIGLNKKRKEDETNNSDTMLQ